MNVPTAAITPRATPTFSPVVRPPLLLVMGDGFVSIEVGVGAESKVEVERAVGGA